MNYVKPLENNLSVVYNGITYEVSYYKPPLTLTGITDETYPEWAVGTTYNVGDYVKIDALKKIYRSTLASNTGNYPLADTVNWVDYGSLNSYNMFCSDENIGSTTTGTDSVMTFDFSGSDTVAFIDVNFITARVTLFDTLNYVYKNDYNAATTYAVNDAVYYNKKIYVSLVDSNSGNTPDVSPTQWAENTNDVYFNEEIHGYDIGCLSFSEYFYTEKTIKKRVILTGLEWLASSILRVEMIGSYEIGTIVYGTEKTLGCSLVGSTLQYEDRSLISNNKFTGFRTVKRYGKIRILDCSVIFDTDEFNVQTSKIDDIISRNILWIPTHADKFSESISIGYIENFTIPMENATKTQTQTKIIGVSK